MPLRRLLVVAACAVCSMVGWSSGQGIGPHLGGGVLTGDAAGLDDGYIHFGGFVPLAQPDERVLFFSDANLQVYNENSDSLGGNVGLGVRSLNVSGSAILGANLFVDRRDLGLAEFHQIGIGLESLGELIDVRINLALPLGPATRDYHRGIGFMGTGIGRSYERFAAFRSLDVEVGALLYDLNAEQLRAFVGAYSLFHDKVDDAAGVRGRLEARIADQLFIGGFVENDGEFGTTGGVTLEFRYGRGGTPSEDSSQQLLARMGDPVQRRRHMMIARREEAEYFTAGASQLQVEHVSELGPVAAMGEGMLSVSSFEEATVSAADIVYIHGGVYEGRSIVVSQDGQRLLAGSMDHTIETDQGTVFLPASGDVVLRNSPGDAIQVAADNVAVIGFTIENPEQDGISTALAPTGAGIVLAENKVTGAGRYGINLANNAAGGVRDNVVAESMSHGIRLAGFEGDLRGNLLTNNRGFGASAEGDVRGDLARNTFDENSLGGLAIKGDLGGNLLENTASNSRGGSGVTIEGSVAGDVAGNVAEGNRGYKSNGITIRGGVTGNVTDNLFVDNRTDGLYVDGVVGGDVAMNEAIRNTNGIHLVGGVSGEVFGNTALDNYNNSGATGVIRYADDISVRGISHTYSGAGIRVEGEGVVFRNNVTDGNAHGAILRNAALVVGNTAAGNYGDGLRLSGTTTGDVVDNTLAGNHYAGLSIRGEVAGLIARNTAVENSYGIRLSNASTDEIVDNTASRNGYGIYSVQSRHSAVVSNDASENDLVGIYISGGTLGALVGNLTSHTSRGRGMQVSGSITGDVADNVSSDNGGNGIDFYGSVNGAFSGNTADGNQGTGIQIGRGYYSRSQVAGTITGNSTNGNGVNGFYVNGSVAGDVTSNASSNNGTDGITLRGSVEGDVAENLATENAGIGINVSSSVTGNITNNVSTDNGQHGIYVSGAGTGDISGNLSTSNGFDGISLYGSMGGDVADNTTNDNSGTGIRILGGNDATPAVGNVIRNTATGNDGDGIKIEGEQYSYYRYIGYSRYSRYYGRWLSARRQAIGGFAAGNTTSRNGGNGLVVNGGINGGVANNTAAHNARDGLLIYGTVGGDIAENNLTANGDNGLDLNGDVSGAVFSNALHGNGGGGYER